MLPGIFALVIVAWLIGKWMRRSDQARVKREADADRRNLEASASTRQPTIVRLYRGPQQSDAAQKLGAEARFLAAYGYQPVGQSWAPGQLGR